MDGLPDTAYRHECHAVFEDFYWGNQAAIRQLEFICERYPDTLGIGANRKVNTTPNVSPTEGAVDLSIAEIVHEILTNDDWGLSESDVNDIDTAGFLTTASTLRTEGNAMSLIWNNGDSIEGLLKTVMQQADGFIFKRLDTALWEMTLNRDDYLALTSPVIEGDILAINEDNASLIRYSRGSWDETINQIKINWQDRNLKGRAQPAEAQDMANFDIQNDRQLATYDLPGIHSSELAANIASRFLRQLSYPIAAAEVVTDRTAWTTNPGDVILFSWADLGISKIWMRVNKISYGDSDQGEIRLSLVQDVFGLAETVFGFPPPTLGVPQNADPIQVADAFLTDQSTWISQQDADNPLGEPKPLILAAAPQGNALDYIPHAKDALESTFVEQGAAFGYAAFGTLETTINPEDTANTGYHATVVLLGVDDTTEIDQSAVYTAADNQALGLGMILIEDVDSTSPPIASPQLGFGAVNELLFFESASVVGSTVTLSNVKFGAEDTTPRKHLAGARVWIADVGTTVRVFLESDTANITK